MKATKKQKMMTTNNELPLGVREHEIRSYDADKRTLDIVFTTGAAVRRYDWYAERYYREELEVTTDAIRMGRLENGAPLLDSHSRWSLRNQIGVVESASVANGEGRATVRLSKREDVAGLVGDITDGIVRNISVGYVTHKIERIAPDSKDDDWIYRAIDWEPVEISFVTVPADAGAGSRAEQSDSDAVRTYPVEYIDLTPATADSRLQEPTLNDIDDNATAEAEKQRAAEQAAEKKRQADTAQAVKVAQTEATDAERARIAGINEAVRIADLGDNFASTLVEGGVSIDAARSKIFEAMAEKQQKTPTRSAAAIRTTQDETDTVRDGMQNALLNRASPGKVKLDDNGRNYRGMRLSDMARECIERAGGKVRGMSYAEMSKAALNMDRGSMQRAGMTSSSDFPILTESTVNRSLRAAYELAPNTFKRWCRQSSFSDFRPVYRTALSGLSALHNVEEGGEYKATQFTAGSESYKPGKRGGIIAFTWESIVNDDLEAFSRLPMMIAAEANQREADDVYAILSANAAMSDGVALFHANHKNLGAGAAISDTALSAGRTAVRKQTGPSPKKGQSGRELNLAPSILLVGADKETEANKYTSAQFIAAKAIDINPGYNTSLEVIVENRVAGNQWYLMCEPGMIDTIEFAYLDGHEQIFTETRNGFDVDGLEMKVRHIFGAAPIDHRGMYSNPGN